MTESSSIFKKARIYSEEMWDEIPPGYKITVEDFKEFITEAFLAGALEMERIYRRGLRCLEQTPRN